MPDCNTPQNTAEEPEGFLGEGGYDQNPFDATIVTIDGLNSFMLVFLDLMTQVLFFIILQSNKCPPPAGG